MTKLEQLKQELVYATEGYEHIQQAWRDGDYDHNYFGYERDNRSAEQNIAKLEKQIARLELQVA